jgi:hypothetical protein
MGKHKAAHFLTRVPRKIVRQMSKNFKTSAYCENFQISLEKQEKMFQFFWHTYQLFINRFSSQ